MLLVKVAVVHVLVSSRLAMLVARPLLVRAKLVTSSSLLLILVGTVTLLGMTVATDAILRETAATVDATLFETPVVVPASTAVAFAMRVKQPERIAMMVATSRVPEKRKLKCLLS